MLQALYAWAELVQRAREAYARWPLAQDCAGGGTRALRVTSGDQGIWHEEPCCNFSDLTRTLVEAEYTFSLHTNSSSRRIEGRTPLAKVASKIHHKI